MPDENKTHYRRAFDSPYLSSADIVAPMTLTISHVRLEPDKTKKTKDDFNTAYFVEQEIREGESLKPMILNATNSRTMKKLTGSAFLEDWNIVPVMIYVDDHVRFGKDTVEGLRISTEKPKTEKISVQQLNELSRAVEEKGYDSDVKLKALAEKIYKLKSISELPSSKFQDAMNRVSKLAIVVPGPPKDSAPPEREPGSDDE